MSRKDRLIKEIEILKDKRKDWFHVLFALASAVIILVYAVISGEKPIFILLLGTIGFIGIIFIAVYYKKIELDIETKLDELEKEE
jgi:hypothetical protein